MDITKTLDRPDIYKWITVDLKCSIMWHTLNHDNPGPLDQVQKSNVTLETKVCPYLFYGNYCNHPNADFWTWFIVNVYHSWDDPHEKLAVTKFGFSVSISIANTMHNFKHKPKMKPSTMQIEWQMNVCFLFLKWHEFCFSMVQVKLRSFYIQNLSFL